MTNHERQQDRDANRSNERLAVRVLALDLMRNNTMLTMLEATQRARRLLELDLRKENSCSQ